MSINFSTLQGLTIPEGVVTQITDASGRVIWAANVATDEPPAIFDVAKKTATTVVGETTYENEEFILFDIYPKKGGTVNVTYCGLTKTIKDTSGAEEPNAQQVFFGTFNGVSDSATTPASGRLTIEGAYRGYGVGSFVNGTKGLPQSATCITNVIDFGNPVYIGGSTFLGCTALNATSLPSGLTSIESRTFYDCTNLALTSLPNGITSIGDYAFRNCKMLNITSFPEGLISIGIEAFQRYQTWADSPMCGKTLTFPSTLQSIGEGAFKSDYTAGEITFSYIKHIVMLPKTPPVLDGEPFGDFRYYGSFNGVTDPNNGAMIITVPKGCIEVYRAENWTAREKFVEAE